MTNQEALEIGLVLAELESQLKARETPASPEEALRKAIEKEDREREEWRKRNPKGIPVIFPGYD